MTRTEQYSGDRTETQLSVEWSGLLDLIWIPLKTEFQKDCATADIWQEFGEMLEEIIPNAHDRRPPSYYYGGDSPYIAMLQVAEVVAGIAHERLKPLGAEHAPDIDWETDDFRGLLSDTICEYLEYGVSHFIKTYGGEQFSFDMSNRKLLEDWGSRAASGVEVRLEQVLWHMLCDNAGVNPDDPDGEYDDDED